MANEITYSGELTIINGTFTPPPYPISGSADQAAAGVCYDVQNVGTSEETLDLGNVTTAGWAFFKNLDDTNFVHIGPDASGIQNFIKLKAGEACGPIPLATTTIKAKADTAAVELEYIVYEA
jgi:hypothetical protein